MNRVFLSYYSSQSQDPKRKKLMGICSMYSMGEHDWLWHGSRKYVEEFGGWFTECPRFDGSTVLGAPHALEWAHVSRGWYARCFGWALEVCAGKNP